MNSRLRTILGVFGTTFEAWSKDNAQRLSAALAFYAIFALTPFLVILIAVAGQIFGHDAVRGAVVRHIGSLIGDGGAAQVGNMIRYGARQRGSVLVSIVGFLSLVLGAAGIFGVLKDALDSIWETAPKPRGKIWNYIRGNLISFGMLLGVALLFVLSLLFTATVSLVANWANTLIPGFTLFALRAIDFLISLSVATVLFALIYRILPEARISWSDVWTGATVTAVLFSIGKVVIGYYLSKSNPGSVFGAAGSIGILLAWIYYSASIFFFGAEFTEVYSRRWGSRAPRPAPVPVPKREKTRSY